MPAREVAAAGAGRIDRFGLLLLLLVTLPFHPLWIDFEAARRGLALLAAALLAVSLPRWRPWPLPGGSLAWAALCAFGLCSAAWSTNPAMALDRAQYHLALGLLFLFGARGGLSASLGAVAVLGAVAAGYGVLQALGIQELFKSAGMELLGRYAARGEPVSFLANLNAAGEVSAVGVAAAAALVARGGQRRAAWFGIAVLASTHLALTGSRGALLAGTLAVVATLPASGRRLRVGLGVLVLALAAAFVAHSLSRSTPTTPATETATPESAEWSAPSPSTVTVRTELWKSSTAMLGEAPLLGHGAGQFRFDYPRFRSQAEIEATSFGRRFATLAATPHNDLLELAVDGGLLALAAVLVFLLRALGPALRHRDGWRDAAPVLALLLAGLTRSPLANAPAACAAFLVLGSLARRPLLPSTTVRPTGALLYVAGGVLGLGLGISGVAQVLAATDAARWLAGGPRSQLDAAIDWQPHEPRYRLLRIQDRCGGVQGGSLVETGAAQRDFCKGDLEAVAADDPHDVTALYYRAQLAHAAGELQGAAEQLAAAHALDPREPRVTLLYAVVVAQAGDVERAIELLEDDPHPKLRAVLAPTLANLVKAPWLQQRPRDRQRLARERDFVLALDLLEAEPFEPGPALTAVTTFKDAPRPEAPGPDPRAGVLLARLQQLAGRSPDPALAPTEPGDLGPSRDLLRGVLEALDADPAWATARGPAGR